MKTLCDLPFDLVMKFTVDNYDVVNEKLFNEKGGVYAVYVDDILKYIGSYSHSFQNRWVNKQKNKNCVKIERHFKYHQLAEMANGSMVDVYAISNTTLQEMFNNPFVNPVGVEYRLIKEYMPELNKMQGHGYGK